MTVVMENINQGFFEEDPKRYRGVIEEMSLTKYDTEPIFITEEELVRLCEGNDVLWQLYEDTMRYVCRYATDVWSMHEFLAKKDISESDVAEEFAHKDDMRTRLHKALIDSFHILSRALAKEGRDNSWILGLEAGGRPAYGRLACILAYRHYCTLVETEVNHE